MLLCTARSVEIYCCRYFCLSSLLSHITKHQLGNFSLFIYEIKFYANFLSQYFNFQQLHSKVFKFHSKLLEFYLNTNVEWPWGKVKVHVIWTQNCMQSHLAVHTFEFDSAPSPQSYFICSFIFSCIFLCGHINAFIKSSTVNKCHIRACVHIWANHSVSIFK